MTYVRIPLFCVIVLLTGCAAVPTVQYNSIAGQSDLHGNEFDNYALQESELKIDGKLDPNTKELDMSTVSIVSVPVEHGRFKLGLTRADRWGVKTTLSLTKRDNTDLVKEVGSEVTDTRVDTIAKIGGIVTKLVPFTGGFSSMPVVIKTLVQMEQNKVEVDAVENVNVRQGITIDFGPLPKDARPISQLPVGKPTQAFIYSACRAARVKLAMPSGTAYEKTVKLSDPRYFQTVNFPLKGKISMHTECGVSVASEVNAGIKSNADIADAIVTQVVAIKKALDDKDAEKDDK